MSRDAINPENTFIVLRYRLVEHGRNAISLFEFEDPKDVSGEDCGRCLPLLFAAYPNLVTYEEFVDRHPEFRKGVNNYETLAKSIQRVRAKTGLQIQAHRNRGYKLVVEPTANPAQSARTAQWGQLKIAIWNPGSYSTTPYNTSLAEAAAERLAVLSGAEPFFSFKPQVFTEGHTRSEMEALLTKLCKENYLAVIGPMDSVSAFTLLESHLLDQFPIPVLSPGSTSAKLCTGDLVHPHFFRCATNDRQSLNELSSWLEANKQDLPTLPIVEVDPSGAAAYGQQNFEVFQAMAGFPLLNPLRYEANRPHKAREELVSRVLREKPRSLALFGISTDLSLLSLFARAARPGLVFYTVSPRRDRFQRPIDPISEARWYSRWHAVEPDVQLDRSPLNGVRAVLDSVYKDGDGVPIAVHEYKTKWTARVACRPELLELFGTAMFGHDAAEILAEGVRRALLQASRNLPTIEVRSLLREWLLRIERPPGCLISTGTFTKSQELSANIKLMELTGGHWRPFTGPH